MTYSYPLGQIIVQTLATLVIAASLQSGSEAALISGESIPVLDGRSDGPLAAGLTTEVVGVVPGPHGDADIFAATNHHSRHPGLFLYRFVERADSGAPVFAEPVAIDHPGGKGKQPPAGAIFSSKDRVVHGFWLRGKQVLRTVYDANARRFVDSPAGPLKLESLPRDPGWLAVMQAEDGGMELLLGINDGTPQRPADGKNWRDPDYRPFDGAGVYRGGWPFVYMYGARLDRPDAAQAAEVRLITPGEREALLSFGSIAPVNLGPGRERDIITGSWFGNFLYYHNSASAGIQLEAQRLVADERGRAHRHVAVRPSPTAYRNQQTGLMSDLIVGGEGALYYYRFSGKFNDNGAPIFADPTPVLERNAMLYAGSLPVINTVDWDGDGVMDIVSGNSEGRVLFFHNAGSNEKPAFGNGVPLHAGDRPIQIQPGYNDVQGPQEARWGYSCPTVADWNEDGLPDILMSSATARHEVFLNIGTRTQPKLDVSVPLFCRGLDLHGTWRVKPGAGRLGGRMAYIALDDDDEIHLYWRIDDYNLEDGGKLRFDSGKAISANFIFAGGTGRSKIVLTDWDRDGKADLLVATPRHGSIGDPKSGLPQSLGLKGAAVVFLKNVGSNGEPVYAAPTLIQFRGEPIYLGQHSASTAVWDIGQANGPDLLVSHQDGRIIFYARSDLSWEPLDPSSLSDKSAD